MIEDFIFDTDPKKNWTEDYRHENGNYLCKCFQCNENFIGHKRRPLCKECSEVIKPFK